MPNDYPEVPPREHLKWTTAPATNTTRHRAVSGKRLPAVAESTKKMGKETSEKNSQRQKKRCGCLSVRPQKQTPAWQRPRTSDLASDPGGAVVKFDSSRLRDRILSIRPCGNKTATSGDKRNKPWHRERHKSVCVSMYTDTRALLHTFLGTAV